MNAMIGVGHSHASPGRVGAWYDGEARQSTVLGVELENECLALVVGNVCWRAGHAEGSVAVLRFEMKSEAERGVHSLAKMVACEHGKTQ